MESSSLESGERVFDSSQKEVEAQQAAPQKGGEAPQCRTGDLGRPSGPAGIVHQDCLQAGVDLGSC